MRKHQRGITAIGWLILLIPVAIVFYAGLRLTPVYLNYMKVVHSLQQVSSELSTGGLAGATQSSIRTAIEKHFNVDSLDYPDVKDIKISRDNGSWVLEANYDDQAPLFANIFILVTFDKSVRIGNGPADGT
jgi:Domain of unknown function (DUF4845)